MNGNGKIENTQSLPVTTVDLNRSWLFMFRLKLFFGTLSKLLFTQTPGKPLTHEKWEVHRRREERLFQIIETPKQYVYLK